MKIGQFIKTEFGELDEVIAVNGDEYTLKNNRKGRIVDIADDILELVRIGDYVNRKQVGYTNVRGEFEMCIWDLNGEKLYLTEIEIEEVVTRQQYEAMVFKAPKVWETNKVKVLIRNLPKQII